MAVISSTILQAHDRRVLACDRNIRELARFLRDCTSSFAITDFRQENTHGQRQQKEWSMPIKLNRQVLAHRLQDVTKSMLLPAGVQTFPQPDPQPSPTPNPNPPPRPFPEPEPPPVPSPPGPPKPTRNFQSKCTRTNHDKTANQLQNSPAARTAQNLLPLARG